MKISEIVTILDGVLVAGKHQMDREISFGFASDLMSDVLTLETNDLVLLTGLCNIQSIRTAEMSDIPCIIFVRRKKVTPEMIELAEESDITLIECNYSMFKTVVTLAEHGIRPLF